MNLYPIKQELQRMRCSIHNEHPEVTVRGERLEFKCCCDDFKNKLLKRSETLIAETSKNEILNQIKKAFK